MSCDFPRAQGISAPSSSIGALASPSKHHPRSWHGPDTPSPGCRVQFLELPLNHSYSSLVAKQREASAPRPQHCQTSLAMARYVLVMLCFAAHVCCDVKFVEIPRRHNPTLAEFDRDFASKSLPVIISGTSTTDKPQHPHSTHSCQGRSTAGPL